MKQNNSQKIENSNSPDITPRVIATRRRAWFSLFVFVCLVIVISFVAFTSTNTTNKSPGKLSNPLNIAPAVVNITSSGYTPTTISVKLGQAVEWLNSDSAQHTIVSDNPKSSSGQPDLKESQTLNQNDNFSYIFADKGTYSYHDPLNTNFHGTVIIN